MGHIRHTAIVVTTLLRDVEIVHAKAVEYCGDLVSPIVHHRINGDSSFFIAPDGGALGGEHYDLASTQRMAFIDYLQSVQCEEFYPQWIELDYGHDGKGAIIYQSTWDTNEDEDEEEF
ncbi:MAG: hypothetical protein JWP44_5048 [Mucilaginibacter sp.]|nr:hypothetical protein [Mucilaginibacter sp.]